MWGEGNGVFNVFYIRGVFVFIDSNYHLKRRHHHGNSKGLFRQFGLR